MLIRMAAEQREGHVHEEEEESLSGVGTSPTSRLAARGDSRRPHPSPQSRWAALITLLPMLRTSVKGTVISEVRTKAQE